MSEIVSAGQHRERPGGLWFVALCGVVAVVALMPWLLAALFAPALLGAPGPSPSPVIILGIAAVLAYPIWLIYWAGRVMAARRAGESGREQALVMVAPAAVLLSVFFFYGLLL